VYGISKWNSNVITYSVIGCFLLANFMGIHLHYGFTFKNDDYRSLIRNLNSNYKAGERIYVEPHYYRWIIEYYNKQNEVPIKPVYIRYGWSEIMDSIDVQRPDRFWIVLDYGAVDTTKYREYKSILNSRFHKNFDGVFYLAPAKVELFRYTWKIKRSAE
jgi:hypothetical protein